MSKDLVILSKHIINYETQMNNYTRIRPLLYMDTHQIAHVIRKVYEEFGLPQENSAYDDETTDNLYQTLTQTPGAEYWVIEDETGRVRGGCGFYPTEGLPEGCVELVKNFVHPEARGKGYGSEVVDYVINRARMRGYKQIYIETWPELEVSTGMYKRRGFAEIPQMLGNSGHTACTMYLMKEL